MLGPVEHPAVMADTYSPVIGEVGAGPYCAGISHTPVAGHMNRPGFGGVGASSLIGDMYAGIGRTDPSGDIFNPAVCGDVETIPVWRCGLIHTDLLGGTRCPGIREVGTETVRSCGHMETTVVGDTPVTPAANFGEIPIGPARSCGDIYATGSVGHVGDVPTPLAVGNMYAGLWAGRMYTGAALQCGYMETT